MQILKTLLLLLSAAAFLAAGPAACTRVSYPADRVASSVQSMMKREYGLDTTAKIVGDTLYLDMRLKELTTTDTQKLGAVMKKIQGAVLTLTRVTLSSDARIRFVVISATDPAWRVGMRIVQYLQDTKDYFYQRISISDYQERYVFELETGEELQLLFSTPERELLKVAVSSEGYTVVPLQQGMTMDEFVGRLIVSQFNMVSRNNPFLGVILSATKLRYQDCRNGELTLRSNVSVRQKFLPLTENLLRSEVVKITKKYPACSIAVIRLVSDDGQSFTIPAL